MLPAARILLHPDIDTMIPSWLDPNSGMTYQEYLADVERYAGIDPSTGATELEREHLSHGPLNLQRMKRIGRTFEPSAETIEQVRKLRGHWLVLSEPWCGDSAQCVPIIARIAEFAPEVKLRIFLRDRYPDIMECYLTDGARCIPKLVAFSADGEELFRWGPRPAGAMEVVARAKADGVPKKEREERLHLWFGRDRGVQVESEIRALVALHHAQEVPQR